MTQTPFQKVLDGLNDKQREAVETIYGPVMVIAGPGSGKTQLLSARIAYILQETDYLASNILCLTFTENAAKNMRLRLASMIGQDAYKVSIHTFHSFGNEIINRFRALSPKFSEAQPLDILVASTILDEILEKLPWNHPYKPGFKAGDMIKEILGDIRDLKDSGLNPEKFRAILESNGNTLKIIHNLVESSWQEMDGLGRKKEDILQKRNLFEQFSQNITMIASQMQQREHGYDTFISLLERSLQEAGDEVSETNSPKALTAWRDSWTQKDISGKRQLKESSKLEKQFALAEIYAMYQGELEKRGFIDFSDMILEAISLLESHEIVRNNLAESFQCIMIDEFQDTNEAQMRLIDLIARVDSQSPNIFAVGDDDQSIYKFQGANTKNLRDFSEKYEGTKLILLEKNYRSTQEVIENSRSILSDSHDIGNIFPGAIKKFEAHKGNGGLVEKKHFSNELEEVSYIVSDIEKKIAAGIQPQDIAIITKKNKTLELFGKALLDKNIPVALSKDESLFSAEEIRLLLSVLKLLGNLDASPRDENKELLVEVISHPCFKIPRLTLWELSKKIYFARSETTRSWIEQIRLHEEPLLQNLGHFLIELSQRSRYERLEDIIDHITGASSLELPNYYGDEVAHVEFQTSLLSGEKKVYTSPFYKYFFTQQSSEEGFLYAKHLANIKKFVDTIRGYKHQKQFLEISDALEIVQLIEKYSLNIEVSTLIGSEKSAVQCITVHKAKGLEWKHVYVPFLTNSEYKMGRFGVVTFPKNLPLQAEKDTIEDIERLVYTAATRAETHLTLSYSDINIQEKSLEALACINVQDGNWEDETIELYNVLAQGLELEMKDLTSLPYLGEEQDFLQEIIDKNFVMNATALQNFLDIASAGPEVFVKRTLLRFPQAKNIAASYGSAMHKALESFMQDYNNKKAFSKTVLLESFETCLKKEGFEKQLYHDYLTRGQENLEFLYEKVISQKYNTIHLEYNFTTNGGVWLPDLDGSSIQLTGKIDRVEVLEDESLIITDYKTGSGFENFDFKGADYLKIKQWKYHLQLCFYAILFELSPRWKSYHRKQYELFFVEKNAKENRFHQIFEYIQQGEVERSKKLILAVMKKIQKLDFPKTNHYPKTLEGIRQFEEDLIEGNI